MSDKNWGILLIITSIFLFASISFLFYTIKVPDVAESAKWLSRALAIFACILQLFVFIMFSRSLKKH